MPRPRGMYKKDGLWYMADGTLARSSQGKVNNTGGTSTYPNVISVAQKPAQSATDPSESITPVATPDNRIKAISVHLYSPEQLERIHDQTGLTLAGFFGEADSAVQVPVFLNPNQSEEDRRAKLAKIRRAV
jgi:hypothetical protein